MTDTTLIERVTRDPRAVASYQHDDPHDLRIKHQAMVANSRAFHDLGDHDNGQYCSQIAAAIWWALVIYYRVTLP